VLGRIGNLHKGWAKLPYLFQGFAAFFPPQFFLACGNQKLAQVSVPYGLFELLNKPKRCRDIHSGGCVCMHRHTYPTQKKDISQYDSRHDRDCDDLGNNAAKSAILVLQRKKLVVFRMNFLTMSKNCSIVVGV
jgi:hypothetical protein